jgi:hypothetical protein
MKTLMMLAAVAMSVLVSGQASAAEGGKEGKKMLYHVVALKFKADTTPEQIKTVTTAFEGLKAKIPGIATLDWGTNVSPEQKNAGFTHCFILTFASDKDRDDYLPHPAHKEFGGVLRPVLADVLVIDFWSQG